jgi:hypothetical protein
MMDIVQELQKHAAECEQMAKKASDVDRRHWREMAERFRQCAQRSAAVPTKGEAAGPSH